tara:strand:+ start:193 stop:654 length:462 start_codon:yes stop_codon:yes gene_type:complete
MHLLIKPTNELVKSLYENHGNFHEGDSGLDLFVPEEVVIPGKSLGFVINLMISCEGNVDNTGSSNVSYYVYPRSSMGSKTPLRLANSVGIIDAGYRGNIMVIVDNISDDDFTVSVGTRLVQICGPHLEKLSFDIVNQLSETTRGEGGLGSTGA